MPLHVPKNVFVICFEDVWVIMEYDFRDERKIKKNPPEKWEKLLSDN